MTAALLEEAYSDILPTQGDRTEDRAANSRSSSGDRAAPAFFIAPSRQHARKATTTRLTRKSRKKSRSRVVCGAVDLKDYQNV